LGNRWALRDDAARDNRAVEPSRDSSRSRQPSTWPPPGASQRYRPGRIAGPAEDRLDRRFAHTLLPIAVGYTLAHYFSLLVLQGQNGYIRASDPFGQGWDLFGTAGWVQNPLPCPPPPSPWSR
jgi:hypothetical protein